MSRLKIYLVHHEEYAKYNVYFVSSSKQEKNTEVIYKAELVRNEDEADLKLFVTNFEHHADIKIMRKNFPV